MAQPERISPTSPNARDVGQVGLLQTCWRWRWRGNHVGPISYHKPHHLGIVSIQPSIPGKSEID